LNLLKKRKFFRQADLGRLQGASKVKGKKQQEEEKRVELSKGDRKSKPEPQGRRREERKLAEGGPTGSTPIIVQRVARQIPERAG